jgi:hypothetical protein
MARTVRLVGVPVDLYFDASRHMGEITREFTLISLGERSDIDEGVSAQLLELADQLRQRYSSHADAIRSQFEEAKAAGRATVDVDLPSDEMTLQLTEEITALLDTADEFCRSGDLLTLASPPEVAAWRHWWRDQVVSQIREGVEPSRFS